MNEHEAIAAMKQRVLFGWAEYEDGEYRVGEHFAVLKLDVDNSPAHLPTDDWYECKSRVSFEDAIADYDRRAVSRRAISARQLKQVT